MRFYIEAYDENGQQILGNCDGQASLECRYPLRTKKVKFLSSPTRPTFPRVAVWRIVAANGKTIYTRVNFRHPGFKTPFAGDYHTRVCALRDQLAVRS